MPRKSATAEEVRELVPTDAAQDTQDMQDTQDATDAVSEDKPTAGAAKKSTGSKGSKEVKSAAKEAAAKEAAEAAPAVDAGTGRSAPPNGRTQEGKAQQVRSWPELPGGTSTQAPGGLDMVLDVPLQVTVELGRTNKRVREVLDLGPGAVVELNRMAGEPVDVLVNGRVLAKGEVVVIDESFGVRIVEIVGPDERLGRLG